MQIRVALIPSFEGEGQYSIPVIVVIDVLRASTTIVTALAQGARQILPVSSIREARERFAEMPTGEALLCGEREGRLIEGFDLGNSPLEYTSARIEGKTLIFASTNGSRMLVQAGEMTSQIFGEGHVLMAGFVNLEAVIQRLQTSGQDCLIACSGREGGYSLEDAVCAGMIVDGLQASNSVLDDAAKTTQILYRHYAGNLAGMIQDSFHGRYLKSIGMGNDLPVCAEVNQYVVVPVLKDGYIVSS